MFQLHCHAIFQCGSEVGRPAWVWFFVSLVVNQLFTELDSMQTLHEFISLIHCIFVGIEEQCCEQSFISKALRCSGSQGTFSSCESCSITGGTRLTTSNTTWQLEKHPHYSVQSLIQVSLPVYMIFQLSLLVCELKPSYELLKSSAPGFLWYYLLLLLEFC